MNTLPNQLYLSVREFAQAANIHPNTVRTAIKNGRISAIQFGEGRTSAYRIPTSELERLALVDLKSIFGIKEKE